MRKDRPLKKLNKFKYKELAYFCYQYNEWLSQIRDIKHNIGVSGVNYDGMPHAHNTASSVENLAIKLAMLSGRVELIEKAAKLTDAGLAYALIRYCTTPGMSFRELCSVETVSCSESTFYRKRSEFFEILNKLKEESYYSELPRKYRAVEKHHRGKWTS
ncbi:hypothetical protein DW721_10840 [Clostridium sp. AM27-31LB]|uniref:hypothetical protein n=1 Tax=Clostridium sp. AM27-31LB TaxID=2293026 RepID=UPI000E5205D2|nr:hypothetical protein [Clostridium sp. AM27-31LB]RHT91593.1 hypothetical protein DW721_10840 [Clostridium sp. AM27-31LB]